MTQPFFHHAAAVSAGYCIAAGGPFIVYQQTPLLRIFSSMPYENIFLELACT
jgi:hypothetical protein